MMLNGSEPGSLGTTRFLAMVARSSSSVRKLWTGKPVSVRLVCALVRAAGEGRAGATTDAREIVRSVLAKHPDVIEFHDRPDRGSTVARLRT